MKKPPLEASNVLSKRDRGAFDYSFDEPNQVLTVKWHDNSAVCVSTNFDKVLPSVGVKRFSRKEKKHVSVPQPRLIDNYNKHMGGVDLMDNFVAAYRIRVRGKKWWWPIFVNFVDVAVVNAWLLRRIAHPKEKCDQLAFRRRLALQLMSYIGDDELCAPSTHLPGPPTSFTTSRIGAKHTIIKTKSRLRCMKCGSQTIYSCIACDRGCHPKCFAEAHM